MKGWNRNIKIGKFKMTLHSLMYFFSWNEWIQLPIKYQDLPRNSQVHQKSIDLFFKLFPTHFMTLVSLYTT